MSIATLLTRLSTARNNIITALGNKGVTATGHGIEDFATDIASITGGGGGTVIISDTTDTHGGTIRTITTDSNATTISALNVTENGTYTASSGQAYSPVIVNVSGGSGTSYTILGSAEFPVNTSSTSEISVGSISCGSSAWTSAKFIMVTVQDKAGPRNGYFYWGYSCAYLYEPTQASSTYSVSLPAPNIYRVNSDGLKVRVTGQTIGIYSSAMLNTGDVYFKAKYHSTNSGTINGTYVCKVWALDLPAGLNPLEGV